MNYLGAMLLEEAGLPLSGYHKFLLNQQKQIPALAAGAYMDPDGTFHSWAERSRMKITEERSMITTFWSIII